MIPAVMDLLGPIVNPCTFYASLGGTLAGWERTNPASRAHAAPKSLTMTGSGAVRYQAASGARINLCKNPSFETNTTGWGGLSASLAQDGTKSAVLRSGRYACKSTRSGGTTNGAYVGASGYQIPVVVGTTYTLSTIIYHEESSAKYFYLGIGWHDAGGTNTVGSSSSGSPVLVEPLTPTLLSLSASPNAGSSTARPTIYNHTSGLIDDGHSFWFDGVLFEAASSVGPYFDGSTVPGVSAWLDPITGILGTAHASPSCSAAAAWVEKATTNLFIRPIAEDTTLYASSQGWVAIDAKCTTTRDTTYAKVGSASVKNVCDGTGVTGVNMQTSTGALTGSLSAQVSVRGASTVKLQLIRRYTDTSSEIAESSPVVLTDSWQEIKVEGAAINGAKTLSYVQCFLIQTSATASTFWADFHQLENKAYCTSPCHGSIGTGYSWSGTAHASSSTRTATTITIAAPNRVSAQSGHVVVTARYDVAATVNYIIGHITDVTDRIYLYRKSNRAIAGRLGGALEVVESGTVSDGITVVHSLAWANRLGTLYKNNERSVAPTAFTGLSMVPGTLYIGSDAGGVNQTDGLVRSVAIFDDELRASELAKVTALAERNDLRWDSCLRAA